MTDHIDGNLLKYTCGPCGGTRVIEMADEQVEAMVHFGLRKLRPNLCPDCERKLSDAKPTHYALQEAEQAPMLPNDGYRHWLADKQAVAAKYGANFTLQENIAAKMARACIWVAEKQRKQAPQPQQKNKRKEYGE